MDALAKEMSKRPRFNGDWQGVPVLNGDVVRIQAGGQVCPGTWTDACSGPEGFGRDSGWYEHNRKDFRDMPHASLVGMAAAAPFFVGRGAQFEIARPGMLVLGVNDMDTGNNRGQGFTVIVEVNPPDLVKRRGAQQDWHAPAWTRQPPAASPAPAPSPAPQSPQSTPPSPAPVAPRTATCAEAAEHAIELIMTSDEMRNASEGDRKTAESMSKGLRDEIVKECEAKPWDANARRCIMDAKKSDELDMCVPK